MTNGILAQAAVPASINGGFTAREGIQIDADVCTPEDERMEAIRQNILRKLATRSKVFQFKPRGNTTVR
jgi:hypothetical protein